MKFFSVLILSGALGGLLAHLGIFWDNPLFWLISAPINIALIILHK